MSFSFPTVTVYLVNHNYGQYIRQSIESVLNQSLQDFELIIIDNGSEDGSREIIEEYTRFDKVLTVFQKNIGLNRTNNVAIEMATGRYVMRLDADDYLHPNALEIMAGSLDRWRDAGLVFPDYFLIDDKGNMLDLVRRHDFNEVTLLDQPAHGACTMIRRECLEALNGYDEAYHCQDGWDLWVRFIRRYGVRNVDLPLFYYRQHSSSLTKNEERILSTRARILQKVAVEDHALQSVAVIPIRGPEIDPRSIALRTLADKAVVDWTIDAALKARRISQVVVTSSDRSIEAHVKQRYGDDVLFVRRDWHLALPSMSLDETLTALFDSLSGKYIDFDAVTLLFVESPFRGARHIDAAIDTLDVFNCNRVIGVRHLKAQLFHHNGGGLVPLRKSRMLKQESEEVYRAAGDLMVIRRGHLYRDTDLDDQVGQLEMDEYAAHRVSSEWSWSIAEQCAEKIKKNNEC